MWKSKGIKLVLVSLVILVMLLAGGCFNKPPTITSLTPSATEVARGESCTVNCVASDENADDTLTYAWSATGGAVSGTGSTITWMAPTTTGSFSVTATVSDGEETVSESCNIQVVNTPPTIASLTPSVTELAPSASCTVGCVASDADGDTLAYAWSATDGTITGTGDSVSWEAPATEGTYTISVEVSDGHGGTTSESCDITVEMKFGSIDIQSNPAGATVFLNGVDTGNITPYVITNLAPGSYTIELQLYHHKYRAQTVTVTPNETTYLNWSLDYAETVTITMELEDLMAMDSYVYDGGPTDNFGNDGNLFAAGETDVLCRSYLQFATPTIPANAVITSAKVGLYYKSTDHSTPSEIGVYPVLGIWTETGVTWNDQPAFGTTPEDTVTVPASVSSSFIYWYITDLVKSWYNGDLANLGLVFKSPHEEDEDSWKGFYSSDTYTSYYPKFIISYYDPNP
jgi:hypothetical protein